MVRFVPILSIAKLDPHCGALLMAGIALSSGSFSSNVAAVTCSVAAALAVFINPRAGTISA